MCIHPPRLCCTGEWLMTDSCKKGDTKDFRSLEKIKEQNLLANPLANPFAMRFVCDHNAKERSELCVLNAFSFSRKAHSGQMVIF